jgi:hypothetical protein
MGWDSFVDSAKAESKKRPPTAENAKHFSDLRSIKRPKPKNSRQQIEDKRQLLHRL